MSQADRIRPWMFKPRQSGNPAERKPKPRRNLAAVQRLEQLGVDPLEEVIALARDQSLSKPLRLKAWLTLCEFAYPRLAPVASPEKVSTRLEELQRSWDTETWDEFKHAFWKELGTLPDDIKRELEKMDAKGGIGPLVMQVLLKFVEMRHEQARVPEEGGLKVAC
jgi:hypothetical protein